MKGTRRGARRRTCSFGVGERRTSAPLAGQASGDCPNDPRRPCYPIIASRQSGCRCWPPRAGHRQRVRRRQELADGPRCQCRTGHVAEVDAQSFVSRNRSLAPNGFALVVAEDEGVGPLNDFTVEDEADLTLLDFGAGDAIASPMVKVADVIQKFGAKAHSDGCVAPLT